MASNINKPITICTICLIEGTDVNNITHDKDVIVKLTECFGKDILITIMPTICKLCVNKIEDVSSFRNLIIRNQNILLDRLKNSTLDNDVKYLKKENEVENVDYKHYVVKSEQIGNEDINTNATEFNAVGDNSDSDDLTLSFIKKSKENIHKNKKRPKKQGTPSKEMGIENNTNRCLTCFKSCVTQKDLVKHYNKEHNTPQIKNKKDIIYEIVTDDKTIKFKCKKCAKLFESKVKINKHMICHVEERPFVCKLCGRTYKVASEIVRHGRVHDGLKVPCKFRCGYSTAYKGALKQHERRHNKEYTYTCDKCGKGFEVLTWYEQHQNVHTGEKPYVCNICGVAFHMDRYLQVHMRSVHPHSSVGERFLCIHCSKPCSSTKALTLHLKEHGITSKFLCDMCGKVFSEARLLKLHKRMHLGVRPFSCSICNKSFLKRSNLTVHTQTHSGERRHACGRCGKRYTQRGTLLRHVQRFHKTTSLDVVRNEP